MKTPLELMLAYFDLIKNAFINANMSEKIAFFSVVISLVTLILSIIAILISKKANDLSKEANDLSRLANELSQEANKLAKKVYDESHEELKINICNWSVDTFSDQKYVILQFECEILNASTAPTTIRIPNVWYYHYESIFEGNGSSGNDSVLLTAFYCAKYIANKIHLLFSIGTTATRASYYFYHGARKAPIVTSDSTQFPLRIGTRSITTVIFSAKIEKQNWLEEQKSTGKFSIPIIKVQICDVCNKEVMANCRFQYNVSWFDFEKEINTSFGSGSLKKYIDIQKKPKECVSDKDELLPIVQVPISCTPDDIIRSEERGNPQNRHKKLRVFLLILSGICFLLISIRGIFLKITEFVCATKSKHSKG